MTPLHPLKDGGGSGALPCCCWLDKGSDDRTTGFPRESLQTTRRHSLSNICRETVIPKPSNEWEAEFSHRVESNPLSIDLCLLQSETLLQSSHDPPHNSSWPSLCEQYFCSPKTAFRSPLELRCKAKYLSPNVAVRWEERNHFASGIDTSRPIRGIQVAHKMVHLQYRLQVLVPRWGLPVKPRVELPPRNQMCLFQWSF